MEKTKRPQVSDAEFLAVIARYKLQHDGVAPTAAEVVSTLGFRSARTYFYRLDRILRAGGVIRLVGEKGSSRNVAFVDGYESYLRGTDL